MRLIFLWGALFTQLCFALEIPKGLSESDRREVVRTIGLNSATKFLTNPYPLGGYSGLEMGYSLEYIDVRDMRRLGCTPGSAGCANTSYSDETEWRYSRFTVGKGLYNDVDVFFHFAPPAGGVRMMDYGGVFRWSFYQAQFLPLTASLLVSGDQLNFNDTYLNRNLGADIILGVNVDNFALYFGGGIIEAKGTFIGSATCGENCTVDSSDPQINHSSNTVSQSEREIHTVVGMSAHHQNLFGAAEVDRYRDAVYSLKMGLRY